MISLKEQSWKAALHNPRMEEGKDAVLMNKEVIDDAYCRDSQQAFEGGLVI